MYKVPADNYLRIHHCRPRFKSDVENVLLYMAQESVKIPDCSVEEYSAAFNNAIRLYPGNSGLAIKTINNWRTEISSLFGFYIEDKEINITKTGEVAKVLATQQDLIQFFKYFVFSFHDSITSFKRGAISPIVLLTSSMVLPLPPHSINKVFL